MGIVATGHLKGSQSRLLSLLVVAGWPEAVGPNDKRKSSHNRLSLDGATVHTFYTKGHGFFVFDPELNAVTRGASRDQALIAMVDRRQTLSPRDSGWTGDPSGLRSQ